MGWGSVFRPDLEDTGNVMFLLGPGDMLDPFLTVKAVLFIPHARLPQTAAVPAWCRTVLLRGEKQTFTLSERQNTHVKLD